MIKKTLHILVITILALNLMGAWAFASAFDCGMECCQPSETAQAGIPTYEAPSCCAMDDITCDFETGQYQELFDTAICCHTTTSSVDDTSYELLAAGVLDTPTHIRTYALTFQKTSSPPSTPVYLSNASFLC
jgi:hypothetical protein